MIKPCTCVNQTQDRLHGKGMRVHNYTPKGYGSGAPGWRCTVCLDVKHASVSTVKQAKD